MSLDDLDRTLEARSKEVAARRKCDLHQAFLQVLKTPEGRRLWSAFNR